ncbi:MAG TPA: hypothetical protein VNW52_11520 [Burkholderiaceae bacterium]|jgi:hypothetical protein|nr:hypothetical protein [Burkholderiaceae bacterium]
MGHLDKIVGVVLLVASVLVLVGIMSTDAYSLGAKAQASGDVALTQLFGSDTDAAHLNGATQFAALGAHRVVTQ